jgi:hypothetical protein
VYTNKLLDRFKLSKSNPILLPIPAGIVLILTTDMPITSKYEPLYLVEVTIYRQAVRSLIYLTNCTQLDLCYTVGQLARHI